MWRRPQPRAGSSSSLQPTPPPSATSSVSPSSIYSPVLATAPLPPVYEASSTRKVAYDPRLPRPAPLPTPPPESSFSPTESETMAKARSSTTRGLFHGLGFFVECDSDLATKKIIIKRLIVDNGGTIQADPRIATHIILLENDEPTVDLTPEWQKEPVIHPIYHSSPDTMLFGGKTPWPKDGKGWTTDLFVRHYAQVVTPDKWYVGRETDSDTDAMNGCIEGELDERIPYPAFDDKVILRDGWLGDCLKQGKILVNHNSGGWIVGAAYPLQFDAQRRRGMKSRQAKAHSIAVASQVVYEIDDDDMYLSDLTDNEGSSALLLKTTTRPDQKGRSSSPQARKRKRVSFAGADGDEESSSDEAPKPKPKPKVTTARNSTSTEGLLGLRRPEPPSRRHTLPRLEGQVEEVSSVSASTISRSASPRIVPQPFPLDEIQAASDPDRCRSPLSKSLSPAPSLFPSDKSDQDAAHPAAAVEKAYQRFLVGIPPKDREAVSFMMGRLIDNPKKTENRAFFARMDQDRPYKLKYLVLFTKYRGDLLKRLDAPSTTASTAKKVSRPESQRAYSAPLKPKSTILANIGPILKKKKAVPSSRSGL